MSQSSSTYKDTVYSQLSDYVDGDLASNKRQQFETALKSLGDSELVDRFKVVRGKLQLSMQGYYLNKNDVMRLHDFVEDKALRETQEAVKIDQVGRKEFLGDIRRRLTLVFLIAGIIFVAVYTLTPPRPKQINPLVYFAYEAIAFEEDPDGRLDLPSNDAKEIQGYLLSYPGLRISPKVIMPASGWEIEGSSVLDYDAYKVAVVKYGNNVLKEKLFHFTMPGRLIDLPKADQGNERGLIYQTYSSDRLNLIAWQQDEQVLAFLVGRRSAPELAQFARGN